MSLSIPKLMLLRIRVGMKPVDVVRAEIPINLEVDPSHARRLHAITVEGWVTRKWNVEASKEIKRPVMLSLTK